MPSRRGVFRFAPSSLSEKDAVEHDVPTGAFLRTSVGRQALLEAGAPVQVGHLLTGISFSDRLLGES